MNQWLVNKVSKDEFALYSVIFSLLIFIPLLTGIIGGALGRFVTVAYAKHDEREVSEITSTMFPLCVVAAVLVLAIGTPMAFHIESLMTIVDDPDNPDRVRLVPGGWDHVRHHDRHGGFPGRRAAVSRMGIHVKQKFVLANVIGLGCELLRIVTLLALMFLVDTRVLWVIVATVPSTLIEVWLTTSISRRLVPALQLRRRSFRADLFKPILTYGWWTLLIRLVVQLRETVTLLLLRNNMVNIEAGAFGLASRFDNQLRQECPDHGPDAAAGADGDARHRSGRSGFAGPTFVSGATCSGRSCSPACR